MGLLSTYGGACTTNWIFKWFLKRKKKKANIFSVMWPPGYPGPRNLPSTGFFPFLQTLMCTSDSNCHSTPRSTYSPQRPRSRSARYSGSLPPCSLRAPRDGKKTCAHAGNGCLWPLTSFCWLIALWLNKRKSSWAVKEWQTHLRGVRSHDAFVYLGKCNDDKHNMVGKLGELVGGDTFSFSCRQTSLIKWRVLTTHKFEIFFFFGLKTPPFFLCLFTALQWIWEDEGLFALHLLLQTVVYTPTMNPFAQPCTCNECRPEQ